MILPRYYSEGNTVALTLVIPLLYQYCIQLVLYYLPKRVRV
jgi:hypothetical protein